ncbi:MAG TPA: sigma factor, partial [Solirubrobacterales bacterium]|nr:sigma factor [Solirubrobacterales bacterium]
MHVLNPQTLPQYVDRLFRAAWMLCGSREDAEDLVQETFARVLLRPRMVRGTSDLAYLMKALRNEFVSGRRAASSRPEVATANDEIDSMAVDTRPDAAHVVLAH